MSKRVGFDRMIKMEWLDAVAGGVQYEKDGKKLRVYLHNLLKNDHPNFEARRKTITVMMRIWFHVPQEYVEMRERASHLINDSNANDRIWIHWGMILLAYPFFRDVVSIINRLFVLQGEFSVSQVIRKMEESWGQRTTVIRATQRVIRSLSDWGVIDEMGGRGVYTPAPKLKTSNLDIEIWFTEAVLRAESSDFIPLEEVYRMPSAFPFAISLSTSDLMDSHRFELTQQGLNRGTIIARGR